MYRLDGLSGEVWCLALVVVEERDMVVGDGIVMVLYGKSMEG